MDCVLHEQHHMLACALSCSFLLALPFSYLPSGHEIGTTFVKHCRWGPQHICTSGRLADVSMVHRTTCLDAQLPEWVVLHRITRSLNCVNAQQPERVLLHRITHSLNCVNTQLPEPAALLTSASAQLQHCIAEQCTAVGRWCCNSRTTAIMQQLWRCCYPDTTCPGPSNLPGARLTCQGPSNLPWPL